MRTDKTDKTYPENLAEAVIVRADQVKPSSHTIHDNYGPWHLDRERLTLTLSAESPSGYEYEIDLEDLNTSGQMLDTIMQIDGKTWASSEVVASLVEALNDIFNPQANLCSCGSQKKISDVGKFLRKRL